MDPNAALAELRELANEAVWKMDPELLTYVHGRMCEVFTALDEWVSAGNFLPSDWQRGLDRQDTIS